MKKKTPAKRAHGTTKRPTRRVTAKKQPVLSKAKTRTQPKGVAHHAKRLYHMTPKFIHGMITGAFVGIILVASLGVSSGANALTISTSKDCDSYSIINCGVQSSTELKNKYTGSSYIRAVYNYSLFGISTADINSLGQTAVKGTVYDDGTVRVAGKVVATDAITAARLRVTANDKKITSGGATFYTRHLKTSWSHTSAAAYVVMSGGKFQFALLAPCGNPIVGTPKLPPKTPPPPVEQPQPNLTCDLLTASNTDQAMTYTFTATATPTHTTITDYVFTLNNGSATLTKTLTSNVLTYTFAKPNNTYTVSVKVDSTNVKNVTSAKCVVRVTTPGPNECKPGIPAGDSRCTECKPGIPAGDSRCSPPVPVVPITTTPTTLVNTGPGAIILIAGLSILGGYVFHIKHLHSKHKRHAHHRGHHSR